MSSPASILKDTFGYNTFRPLQSEVIENVLARHDTLAVMPTGGRQVKLEKYGDAFLVVIESYCDKHGLEEIPHPRPFFRGEKGVKFPSPNGRGVRCEGETYELPARTRIVGEEFNNGATMQELMEKHGVKANTILDHLNRYLLTGNTLRNENDLQSLSSATPEQQQAAFAAFDELSPTYLKPVFDKLNGKLSYDELKILRMMYLISRP